MGSLARAPLGSSGQALEVKALGPQSMRVQKSKRGSINPSYLNPMVRCCGSLDRTVLAWVHTTRIEAYTEPFNSSFFGA